MTTEPETFKNRQEAHDWLLANGYKVSSGKFYQDIKRKGFPVVNPDKTISKYQVAVYGKNLATDQQPDPSALGRLEYTQQKEKAEAEMAIMKAERMRREEDDLWLQAEQAWSALAGVIGNLRDVIRRHLHDEQVRIVLAGGGDPVRAPEVFELLDQVVNRAFTEVAGQEIDIQWESEE